MGYFTDVNDMKLKNSLVKQFFYGNLSSIIISALGDENELAKLYEDSESFRRINEMHGNIDIQEVCYIDPVTRLNNASLLISKKRTTR